MKKPFAVFVLFFSAALPAFSASTCETRVDKHQDATTLERASYCLTPEAEQPAPAGPELVYYGVSANEPQDASAEEVRYKQKYFDKDGVAVSQDYVSTRKFPAFANDIMSEQERLAREEAEKEAAEKARAEAEKQAAAKKEPLRTEPVPQDQEQDPPMTKAQRAARQTKPKRFMKEPAAVQTPEEPVAYAPDPYGANPDSDPYSAAPYATGTPQGELPQAQALENDPLSQPAPDPYGALPNGFADDNLLDDPSFGYNATDPSMQP